MAENVLNIDDRTFDSEVLSAKEPVLVDFWGDNCAVCVTIAPMLEDLAGQYKGKVKIAKLNVSEHQEKAQEYGVRMLPTLLLFKDGRVLEQIGGAIRREKLEASFRKAM